MNLTLNLNFGILTYVYSEDTYVIRMFSNWLKDVLYIEYISKQRRKNIRKGL